VSPDYAKFLKKGASPVAKLAEKALDTLTVRGELVEPGTDSCGRKSVRYPLPFDRLRANG